MDDWPISLTSPTTVRWSAIIRDRIQDGIKRGMTLAAGEGGEADARLRPALRQEHRSLDDGHVRRGGRIEASEGSSHDTQGTHIVREPASVLAGAGRAFAHHSFTAAYEPGKRVEIEGVVKEFVWRNPHSFVRHRSHGQVREDGDVDPRVGLEHPVVGREVSRDADDAQVRRPHHRGRRTRARS